MDPLQMGISSGKAAASESSGQVTSKFDLGHLDGDQKRQWLDGFIGGVEAAGRNIEGVRVGAALFQTLGVQRDGTNCGSYRDVRFVETQLDLAGVPIEIVIEAE